MDFKEGSLDKEAELMMAGPRRVVLHITMLRIFRRLSCKIAQIFQSHITC